ncbi:MAG: diguanylate cyclase [Yoonia sp.]|uniref:diguanylate cyclase n=1 Tax=Yoonia sp. TaxID=2212373 RepID=UPI00273FCD31|nr:diguanylate cyclase [Yoonia sp.]MDP5085132.1 diguanylate cyclase [Yoonia sp.]
MFKLPARILIFDSIATNRILLKVKMIAARFAVDACANLAEAEIAIAAHRPDIMLINMAQADADQTAFCDRLRAVADAAPIAIIAIGVPDTSYARFAALDAGADDVMSHPINDALLLARIRSLLRVRSIHQELVSRDTISRALGFQETPALFEDAAQIAFVTSGPKRWADLSATFSGTMPHKVQLLDMANVLNVVDLTPAPDLFILDATSGALRQNDFSALASDLRSRSETRLAKQLVVVDADLPQVAAMFLDLGADDVVQADKDMREMALRAKALIRRKHQNDRLRDTLRSGLHAAITDPLTGLYNRRYVIPHLTRMAEDADKSDRPFAVMMIDIDHFKVVNDSYGHAAGDRLLIQLADRLCKNLRAVDMVARMGGEEFLVAMPRTTIRQAKLAADRLRRVVNNTVFDLGAGQEDIKVSVSVGVAVSDKACGETPGLERICDLADKALYAAKSAGRNQVAISKSAA